MVRLVTNEEVGPLGEAAFMERCNRWKCEFLPIRQDAGESFSSELRETDKKRPDFLVNVPDLGPIFVEVKTKKLRKAGKTDLPAFSVNLDDHRKLKNLQSKLGVNIWYAYFQNYDDGQVDRSKAYFIPLSRVEMYLHRPELSGGNRSYVYMPVDCMNICADMLDLRNLCLPCGKRTMCNGI